MSSDQQEQSPDEQRKEVVKLAKKQGCTIIREYFDDGISGSATSKRKAFQKMVADAKNLGDFRAILCWHQDRFGRFDSVEAGEWIAPLRRADVKLITVAQGLVDWTSFEGRIMSAINQEGAYQYSVNLSLNMVRNMASRGAAGTAISRPPFGFDRVYFDASGKQMARIPCGTKFRMPKGWTKKLVVAADDSIVATVRWLFRQFADTDASLQSLAAELNRRGTKTPMGREWRHDTVGEMLSNAVYAGIYAYGKSAKGKFHQIGADGDVVTATESKKRRDPIIVIRDHHEAIIDQQTFDRVQEKLAERRRAKTFPKSAGYLLSGIACCGHCGSRLCGSTNNTAAASTRYYACSNAAKGLCGHQRTKAEKLETMLVAFAQQLFLGPTAIAELEAELTRQATASVKAKPKDCEKLKTQISALSKQIERGQKNMLLAEPEDVPDCQKLIAGWRRERDTLEGMLGATSQPRNGAAADVGETVKRALAELKTLHERLSHASAPVAREAFKSLFSKVTIFYHPREAGERRHHLAKVLIETHEPNGFYAGNRT